MTRYTLHQATLERHLKHALFNAKVDARIAAEKRIADLLQANPQIGTLQRGAKTVYYVNFPKYREASRIETLIA